MLQPVQYLVGSKLEWFKCECEKAKFTIYDEVYEERGVAEFGFDCECGNSYYFHYGYIKKVK